jgi:acyl-CoA synthetase (AMP-forming)/AMP-acid ligase II
METLLGVLERGEAGATAVLAPEGPALTYAALRREVERAAEGLAALGIERGDRVALALPNGAEALVMFLGAAMAATAAPLNPAYTEEEFRFYMDDTGARALVVPPGGGEAARQALPDGALLVEARFDADGALQLESAAPRAAGCSAGAAAGEDVALVLHTSGTTSRPKRVPLRHGNLAASVENIVRTYALTSEDVSLCLMPLFHVHGLVASALAALRAGGMVVIPPRFHPLSFRRLLREHGVTWYSAVPTIHQLALARTGGGERIAEVATLRFIRSCSAALAPATMAQMEAQFGTPVLEAYGMTEASHQIASNPLPPGRRQPGSVGPGTGVQVGILDEAGSLLPPGTPGEVAIQGPNVTVGYENNPEANAASFADGWFRTGDLGAIDGEGYVTLLGRLKELINYGGEKISPREVDEVLLAHPAVAEAVCFGVPHPVWGEVVEAAVVLHVPVAESELAGYCSEHLADFKIPKKIHVVETIPRTATGKLQRRHVAAALGEGIRR